MRSRSAIGFGERQRRPAHETSAMWWNFTVNARAFRRHTGLAKVSESPSIHRSTMRFHSKYTVFVVFVGWDGDIVGCLYDTTANNV
jgi:hypothetical protein